MSDESDKSKAEQVLLQLLAILDQNGNDATRMTLTRGMVLELIPALKELMEHVHPEEKYRDRAAFLTASTALAVGVIARLVGIKEAPTTGLTEGMNHAWKAWQAAQEKESDAKAGSWKPQPPSTLDDAWLKAFQSHLRGGMKGKD